MTIIPVACPSTHFCSHLPYIVNPTVQALLNQNVQLDFRHVKPTPMLWRVVNLKSVEKTPCFTRLKHFIQGCTFMGIEIVHNKSNLLSIWIVDIQKLLNLHCPVRLCTAVCYRYLSFAGQWFEKHKQIAYTS